MQKNLVIRESLRKGMFLRRVVEEVKVGFLLLVPRMWIVRRLRKAIAQQVYGCSPCEVYLYKSGRSALRGLMETLRHNEPERETALVPDYTCNVVGAACRAAGFSTVEYLTDDQCVPVWGALQSLVASDRAPVLVLCSQFGVTPAASSEAAALFKVNPRLFLVADECQNLVPDSAVKAGANRAVVFSFNDKTCPGVMGGGLVLAASSGLAPPHRSPTPLAKRMVGSVALTRLWLLGLLRLVSEAPRLFMHRRPHYRLTQRFDFSTCTRPHYDLQPEPIYKISAARSLVSVGGLGLYHAVRIENAAILRDAMEGLDVGFRCADPGPAFLPLSGGRAGLPSLFPAPVKPRYGSAPDEPAKPVNFLSLRLNMPHLKYETSRKVIAQLTTRHTITDNRILHLMARTAAGAGYESVIIGPASDAGYCESVELRPYSHTNEIRKWAMVTRPVRAFAMALRSRIRVFHFHDPDLIPIGLLLKVFRRRVIYDVHDDYEASLKDRLCAHRRFAGWVPKLWWWIEHNAARAFDGVIVADRHLATKFAHCEPVILGNYPRLDFTPVADNEGEATFNLIYVGGVTRERGLAVILDVLKRLPIPELRLHVVGTGRDAELLKALRAEPRVVMHGRVPWTRLREFYSRAHVGLALYQPLAGFVTVDHSVKIVEYMAAGIPVLCSDFRGLRAFVEDAGCGLVVSPDDPAAVAEKLGDLIRNNSLRKQLGARGRELFEAEFNWGRHESKLIRLYEKVLSA